MAKIVERKPGRLVWADGGGPEVAIGGFGLALLCYDHFCGQAVNYIFDAPLLVPFYEQLFGAPRARDFGGAFRVDLEAHDWSWLRQHGWAHEIRCGGRVWRAQVPTLYRGWQWIFKDMSCPHPQLATYVWRGCWLGPPATLRLFWSGMGTVDTLAGRVIERDGFEQLADFHLEPETTVAVTVTSPGDPHVHLIEFTSFGGRILAWENVSPLPDTD